MDPTTATTDDAEEYQHPFLGLAGMFATAVATSYHPLGHAIGLWLQAGADDNWPGSDLPWPLRAKLTVWRLALELEVVFERKAGLVELGLCIDIYHLDRELGMVPYTRSPDDLQAIGNALVASATTIRQVTAALHDGAAAIGATVSNPVLRLR